ADRIAPFPRRPRLQRDHAWLLGEIAFEPFRAPRALPGLQADEWGDAGLGPDAEVGEIGEADLDARTARRAIGDLAAVEPVENDRVLVEQRILEMQHPALDRRRPRIGRQGAAAQAADRRRLRLIEQHGMGVARGIAEGATEAGMD